MFDNIYSDTYLLCADNILESEHDDNTLISINEAHEIIYCRSGSLCANIEGVQYTVRPGDMLILRDAEIHKIEPPSYPVSFTHLVFSPYYYYFFDPEGHICHPFTEREPGIGCVIPGERLNHELIKQCISSVGKIDDVFMRRIDVFGVLTVLLCEINRVYDPSSRDTHDGRSEILRDIILYINAHLDEELNPDGIAASFFISRSQLDRVFKQRLGFSLWKYITFKRLIRARHMLHAGIANNEVAKQCGFGDYSTFYKVYTRIFKAAPRAAQPTDTTDPLLRKFYQFDDSEKTFTSPEALSRSMHNIRELRMD